MEERENIRERLKKHKLSYVWLIGQLALRGIVTDKTEMSSVISGTRNGTKADAIIESTYMTFLMHKKETAWEKLLDITEFPDLGGDPELLETTTLSDKMQTYVNGVQSNDGMTFNANYDHTEFKALKALEGKNEEYAVWFGGTETASSPTPTGSEGKFKFAGELSVYVTGGGVNEVRGMAITIAPSTPITEDEE